MAQRPIVLVVDDDLAVQAALRVSLEEDYEVLVAADGPSALRLFPSDRIDAVLLDLRMPGMSGFDVLRRLRTLEPRVPVIVVTGVSDVPAVVMAMKVGAADYLTKPWDEPCLHEAVARAVARRREDRLAVLLVGADRGQLAALQVVLERTVGPARSASVAHALDLAAGPAPTVVLFDSAGPPEQAARDLRALRARFAASTLMVLTADAERARPLPDFAAVLPWATLAKPHRLDALLARVAAALESPPSCGRFAGPVASAVACVARRYDEPLRIGDVARAAGVSVDQLGRLFRSALGMGMKDYLLRVRVAVACRLLVETPAPLEEVCRQCGFSDVPYFSRFFLAQVGVRPGEFRRGEARPPALFM